MRRTTARRVHSPSTQAADQSEGRVNKSLSKLTNGASCRRRSIMGYSGVRS